MLCYPFPLKLLQEAYIIFVEQAQVVNVVATHGNTLQTQAKGKAAVFFRINIAVAQYLWVYHTTAENFNPTLVFAKTATFTVAVKALYVNFCGRLCKWEVVRTEPNNGILAVQPLYKGFQCAYHL